jgi:hypothetical protein
MERAGSLGSWVVATSESDAEPSRQNLLERASADIRSSYWRLAGSRAMRRARVAGGIRKLPGQGRQAESGGADDTHVR